jgi:hypothetical protein
MKMAKGLVSAAVVIGLALAPVAFAAGMTREAAVKAADLNGDTRLDGKEMKRLKKEHPKMHANLMSFCESAKVDAKAAGVELPKDPLKQQLHCKKKHVARPFLKAWVDQDPKND